MARMIDKAEAVRIGHLLARGRITLSEAEQMIENAAFEDEETLDAALDEALCRARRS